MAVIALLAATSGCGDTGAEAPKDRPADREFLEALVPAHQSAIDLANTAVERGEHTELRRFGAAARSVRRDQLQDMASIGLLKVDPEPSPSPAPDAEPLTNFAPFDRAFIDTWISASQGAIRASQAAVAESHSKRVRILARQIVADQACEIVTLNEWRQRWHGLPSPAGGPPLSRRELREVRRRCRSPGALPRAAG